MSTDHDKATYQQNPDQPETVSWALSLATACVQVASDETRHHVVRRMAMQAGIRRLRQALSLLEQEFVQASEPLADHGERL